MVNYYLSKLTPLMSYKQQFLPNYIRLGKAFDLVYPNFKGTCIELINGIMQVCWHFKPGLHWNWQGYFGENSSKCRKQYKALTNSIRKLTTCIDNAGPLRGPALYQYFCISERK